MAITTRSHSLFFRIALLFCLGLTCLAGHSAPPTTNAIPETDGKAAEEAFITNQESIRSYLQIQEQLHTLQVVNEKNRLEAEAAAARNAELLQMQLDNLQKSVISQRRDELNELKVIHQSNGHVLVAAGAFLALGFLVLLSAIFFQWNVVNRLTALAASLPEHPLLGPGRATAALGMGDGSPIPGQPALEQSNNRFLAIVERLEQRLLDMETGSRPPLRDGPSANGSAAVIAVSHDETNGAEAEPAAAGPDNETNSETSAPGASEHTRTITSLIGKGQTLLKLDQPEAALACFDEILSLDAGNTDALVKKGAALERLQRLNEAIDCYDRAIATDNSMTMAYLYKGGVFNRMERYTEALECYERALRTQDKSQAVNMAVS
jgi:tetratricopeptide (TPR) repeat protein